MINYFNRHIRKTIKNKGSFPTDDSLFKILYLIVMDADEKWTMPIQSWVLFESTSGVFR